MTETLAIRHDALLFDLDGTLFRGRVAVSGAPEAVADLEAQGVRTGYLTNNGSRSAEQVAEHLRGLGYPARTEEVVTSAQAAARLLASRLEPGASVLVVGTGALVNEVTSVGLTVVDSATSASAVVQGHSPATAWPDLAEACLAIRAGALWVACNTDATLPDERGELPGNGAMVAALKTATGKQPLVAGKPEAALFTEAIGRTGARQPLMVGDRLETDIAGARAVGISTLLVLSGVTDPTTLLTAPEPWRPDYVGADLAAAVRVEVDRLRVAAQPPWRAERSDSGLVLARDPDAPGEPDPLDALRTLCAAHWGTGGGPVKVRAGDADAACALDALGLAENVEHPVGQPVD